MTLDILLSSDRPRWYRRPLQWLADLRLAILLLLAIALFSITGTVIEQGQTLSFYQDNYPESPALFGFLTWKVVLAMGLNHVYSTWWYLLLLVVFGGSLTACTFRRQLPALKAAQTWKFYRQPRQFEKLALSTDLPGDRLDRLPVLLQQRRYRLYREGNSLYARKGIAGRIGPIIVHVGMLVVLAGGMWGALGGFIAQEMIPSGDQFRVDNVIDAGPLAQGALKKDWQVKVNRFWIDYTPQGNIDQFYSDLSVVDEEGAERFRKTIHVNEPMRYDGITFYQTSWSIAAVRVQINNSPIFQLPMAQLPVKGETKVWGTWIPTKPDLSAGVALVTQDLQGTMLLYDTQGKLMNALRPGVGAEVNGVTLKVVEVIGSTGLQIKSDPGVPLVYLGFALVMVGVVMSYFSHSQIWALVENDRLYLGGRTNRAQVTFERELLAIVDGLGEETSPAAV